MFMLQCDICPRNCFLAEQKTGFCGVRTLQNGKIVLQTYGKSTGFAVDPVEKKPLNHFYPGSQTLSFGSIGCNLSCTFCQNASTAQTGNVSLLHTEATPDSIVALAAKMHCQSVAFTYNEPIISAEFVTETAAACRKAGIKTIAVSNGYISEIRRKEFFDFMDAANIDLKSFSEDFYRNYCSAELEPVKQTIRYLSESKTWLEITVLLIPARNDSDQEIAALSQWIAENAGTEVPLHFSAFHPANRMLNLPPTPPQTLFNAREIAFSFGLKYVYTGNIRDPAGQSTTCPQCGQTVIARNGYKVEEYHIDAESCCRYCGQSINGKFEEID
ncbi:MAG: AmmeMemoRadiSam system radical SAM enzyme [Planctomycetaceae bacterium]|jgi:pyruvate formate lyase activating enzyme|nr:AmmeMemoRadiSam system radical SAM enzyme [Planctomycetaceae bacterium]